MSPPRYFTLQEANLLLPALIPLVEAILAIRVEILRRQPEAWPVIQKAAGNGGGKAANELVLEFGRLDQIVRQVQAMGVIVKDINTGLLDFPALREGREVYLCWRYGEPSVQFWHDIDTGFAGRQPVD